MHKNSCQDDCPEKYFDDSGVCKECSKDCETCANKSDYCLTCPPGKLMQDNTCVDSCTTGFY